MADKLKQGISVLTTFTDGEQPTAAKLNSITAQLRAAAAALESAVGDIHGESWPYHSDTTITLSGASRDRTTVTKLGGAENRKLDIANLGRLVGPASMLNPRTLGSSSIEEATPVGVSEFGLKYIPEDPSAVVFTDPSLVAYVASPTAITTSGEYSITAEGRVVCVKPTQGGTATYTTDPTTYGGGANNQGAQFNVIPDPSQISAGGASLAFSAEDAQGRRTVTLPLISHQQSNIDGTAIALDGNDINEGLQAVLPLALTEGFVAGDIIPAGFLLLKNETTGEVYTEAEYTYNSSTTFLVGNVDLTAAITAGNVFSVLTVGNDLTTAVDDLRLKAFTHSHDREFGEAFINIDSVIGWLAETSASGSFIPSEISGNHAPQYLHRDGWRSGTDAGLNDENAMRGDIFMADSANTQGSRVDVFANNSYRIRFGHSDVNIYKDNGQVLTFNGRDGFDTADRGFAWALSNTTVATLSNPPLGSPHFDLIDCDMILDENSGLTGTPQGFYKARPFFSTGVHNFGGAATWETLVGIPADIINGTIVGYQLLLQDPFGQEWWAPGNGDATWEFYIRVTDDGTGEEPAVRAESSTNWLNSSINYRIVLWWV